MRKKIGVKDRGKCILGSNSFDFIRVSIVFFFIKHIETKKNNKDGENMLGLGI